MRRVFITLLAGLFLSAGTHAIASELANGFYIGGSGGLADNLSTCDEIGNPVSPSKCEDSDFGWQVFAGWQFLKWISVETGWTSLGQASSSDTTGGSAMSETDGLQINAVATAPILDKAGVYLKLGAYIWDLDVTQTDALNVQQKISDTGVDYVLGVGLRYPLTETFGLGFEYQRFQDIGTSKTGSFDSNLWTAGILLRF